jgi:hypothetical protein
VERYITDSRAEFDPDYAARLGRSALPALVRHPDMARDVGSTVNALRDALTTEQADWRTWTLRGALIEHSLP